MIFKHKDLMSSVLPVARPWGGWPDGMEPWAAADGECKQESCKDNTAQCVPTCGQTAPCSPSGARKDQKTPRLAANLGLLQEQLRQALALGP